MGDPVADSKTPVYIAVAMVAVGILIAALQGFTHGSIGGGIIAAAGAIPACFGMWKGIQQETQRTLALSVSSVLLALGVGGILIVLRIVYWIR
jgi:peptidoglycan biosynthesis protein MviN/MurJ (putative lipid II flippase)